MIFLVCASWSLVAMGIGLAFGIDDVLLGGFVALCLSWAGFHVSEAFQARRARRIDRLMAWATDPDAMDWDLIERNEDWQWPRRAA